MVNEQTKKLSHKVLQNNFHHRNTYVNLSFYMGLTVQSVRKADAH